MRILLTGGCGYIGTVLTGKLLRKGYDVTVVDTMWFGNYLEEHENLKVIKQDIRDTEKISLDGIDAVIHLAAVANDPCVELDEVLSWEVNVLATMRLIDKALRKGTGQFIYASSGSVYGVKEEPQVTEELELTPISAYNKTKMVAERVVLSYKDDMTVQVIRPATVCGYSPRMRLDLSVNLLTMQALEKGRITVLGGDQTRPNIHIQDMTDVYLHVLEGGNKVKGVYNAGFENLSIMNIAEKVADRMNVEIEVKESNDPRSYRMNSDKILSTGFNPSKNVEAGIQEVIDGYRSGNIKDLEGSYNIKHMKKMFVK